MALGFKFGKQSYPNRHHSPFDFAHSVEFRLAEPGYEFQFPRDHGSHDEFRTEWWYTTGHLQDDDGARFGFEVTFFRVGIDPDGREGSAWTLGHGPSATG